MARVWEASPAAEIDSSAGLRGFKAESRGEWVKKRETKAADLSREEGGAARKGSAGENGKNGSVICRGGGGCYSLLNTRVFLYSLCIFGLLLHLTFF